MKIKGVCSPNSLQVGWLRPVVGWESVIQGTGIGGHLREGNLI